MKNGFKICFSIIMAFVLTLGVATTCIADTNAAADVTDDQIAVTLATDKDSYAIGDAVKVTVKVTNTSEEELSDLNVRVNWPDYVAFDDEADKVLVVDNFAAGASQTFEVTGKVMDPAAVGNGAQEGGSKIWIIIGSIIGGLAIVAIVVALIIKNKKNGKNITVASIMIIATLATMVPNMVADAGEKVNASKEVTFDGTKTNVSVVVSYNQYYMSRIARVTVHDPSVVYDPTTDMYYIFGSHMAWAKSEDMISWKMFQNNINTDYRTLFAEPIEWSKKGSSKYNIADNMWAPDVIYNEELGKWTMYMSINGDNWYSSIVMLTADTLDGDWTYVGPVVYSGFTNKAEAQETDFYDVYTGTDFPERYNKKIGSNHSYGLNAIDPCVFYDEEGRLWMAYGSWFGGIYMLELDPTTGFRLESHTYTTEEDKSDEYQGIKIAGGDVVSGEGAYIQYVDGYYYLYLSYGGLKSNGGYNMRLFRSENPDGPYVDLSGDSAIPETSKDNVNGTVGIRIMGNYQWDYVKSGHIAQGHNSVYKDEDGNIFLVYHTRFTNQGEVHSVRVHQQFVNEDGWLVTAPFDYAGEGLAYVDAKDVAGDYKVIVHNVRVNYANKQCHTPIDVTLKEDGTVTGAKEGTWEFSEELGAPYVTMVLDDVEYKGVFVKQRMDNSSKMAMTFTVLGTDEFNVWGYCQIDAE